MGKHKHKKIQAKGDRISAQIQFNKDGFAGDFINLSERTVLIIILIPSLTYLAGKIIDLLMKLL